MARPFLAPDRTLEILGFMLERAVAALVGWSARRAILVVLVLAGLAVWAGIHVVHTLKMNSDTSAMISSGLVWRQQWEELGRLFPQNKSLLVVVVDGRTPDQAEDATQALYEALAGRSDLFTSVRRPDGGPFFQRYGMLFLPVETLQKMSDSIAMAQPFIASLRADPSLRGLFDMLGLAAGGISQQPGGLAMLQRPVDAIEASLTSTLDGKPKPLSWQTLLMDRPVTQRDLHHLILTQPVRDFSSLATAAAATRFIRDEAQRLGLTPDKGVTVRLTGSVALEDQELQTATEGLGTSLAVSIALVLGLLLVALRSAKLILASFVTLLIGLVLTFAFASYTVNPLNPISVAFAVMFIGLSIDFGIQFGVRFGQERFLDADPATVLPRTGYAMARPLTLAAAAIAVGFASFLPTDYRGVSELGLIATAGMVVTLVLNLTLMPALLALLKPSGQPREMGYGWAASIDEFLLRKRRWVLAAFGLVTLLGVGAAFRLEFDYNPLHLRDPKVESMATILDLMRDPLNSPFTIEALAPNIDAAQEMAKKLSALPEVAATITAASFVPPEQGRKLAIIGDLQFLIGPTLDQTAIRPAPSDDEIRSSMRSCAEKLRQALPDLPVAQRLAVALDRAAAADASLYPQLTQMLIAGLDARLKMLSVALTAEPLDLSKLPDDLRRDWITPDGRARVQAMPSGDSNDNETVREMVTAVRKVVPDATGSAVQIYESGRAVANAFRIATITALVAVMLLLGLVLRRVRDVALVLAPILVAGSATILAWVVAGLEFNFANIIALPLLLGIGVAFTIYFVVNWRKGVTHPLTSSMARAVLFSALATGASFGSLTLSTHPGTAGMGLLLLLGLVIMLSTIFLFLPALMGPPPQSRP
jgi:hopanoid biosynthesis associated RND transporter like protein HpnN